MSAHPSDDHRKKVVFRSSGGYDGGMTEARIAVLEQFARETREAFRDNREALARLETKMEAGFARQDAKAEANVARLDAKIDTGLKEVRDRQEHDFRLIFGVLITTLAAVAAWLLTSAANLVGHKLGLF